MSPALRLRRTRATHACEKPQRRMTDSAAEEAFWRQRFDDHAMEPLAWVFTARNLRRAATALYVRFESEAERLSDESRNLAAPKDFHLIGPILLLAGFAIENLLKGILVRNTPGLISGGDLPQNLLTHDLVKLSQGTQVHVSAEERQLLEELTENSIWMGRYPIPRTYRHRMPRKRPDGSGEWRTPTLRKSTQNGTETGTFATFERLFDRLASYLATENDLAKLFAPGWD